MSLSYSLFGSKTGLIYQGEDLLPLLLSGITNQGLTLVDGDILVIAESALATSEGRLVSLVRETPSQEAEELATQYDLDPRLAEIVLRES